MAELVYVVIPTYNERKNISAILEALAGIPLVSGVIVVDDHSPDGTATEARETAEALQAMHPQRTFDITVLERIGVRGLGSAYCEGFRAAIAKGAGVICQMDADGSHDPSLLPHFIERVQTCEADVVIGSRRVPGGNVAGWNWVRNRGSLLANRIARTVLHMRTVDTTSGYRVMRTRFVQALLQKRLSSGYAFQMQAMYYAERLHARIIELPITFADRTVGRSKLSRMEVVRFFWTVARLALVSFRRSPAATVVVIAAITMLAASIPFIAGVWQQPEHTKIIALSYYSSMDTPVYYSYIRQVMEGGTLVYDKFTMEPHTGSFLVVWWVVGQFGRLFNLEPITAFHLARIASVPFVVYALWYAVRTFIPKKARLLALVFTIASSGFGVAIYTVAMLFGWNAVRGIDLWVPEGFTFMSILDTPHFAIALGLFALILSTWFRATVALNQMTESVDHKKVNHRALRYIVASGLMTSVLFSFHPFHILSLGLIVISHTFVLLITKKQRTRMALHALLWGALAVPGMAYQLAVQFTDPMMAARSAQNLTLTPGIPEVFAAYIIFWLAGIFGLRALMRAGSRFPDAAVFLLLWCSVQTLMVFAPVSINRRLVTGLHIGLSMLAAVGTYTFFYGRKVLDRKQGSFVNVAPVRSYARATAVGLCAFLLFGFSSVNSLAVVSGAPHGKAYHWYISEEAATAFAWLEANTAANDVILASNEYWGNMVPALTGRTTYAGHYIETIGWPSKSERANRIFSAKSPAAVETLLKGMPVQYLFAGPEAPPLAAPVLTLVYDSSGFRVYRVSPL